MLFLRTYEYSGFHFLFIALFPPLRIINLKKFHRVLGGKFEVNILIRNVVSKAPKYFGALPVHLMFLLLLFPFYLHALRRVQ